MGVAQEVRREIRHLWMYRGQVFCPEVATHVVDRCSTCPWFQGVIQDKYPEILCAFPAGPGSLSSTRSVGGQGLPQSPNSPLRRGGASWEPASERGRPPVLAP
jgi:hypothetical protein